ncbi:MAG: type IV pilin protein [Gammaproteobacteria bacterium]|nr:type IV pilin protein [Gammaproteobacteria bacterium]
MMSTKQAGFNLVELMITVAIVATLAAIAIPAYSQYVTKARRSDAKVALMRAAQFQEGFFADNLGYAETSELSIYKTSPDRFYAISVNITEVVSGANVNYTLTAQPAAGSSQAGDVDCATFQLTLNGVKSAKTSGGDDNDDCW